LSLIATAVLVSLLPPKPGRACVPDSVRTRREEHHR
jgi:hypothetical protein